MNGPTIRILYTGSKVVETAREVSFKLLHTDNFLLTHTRIKLQYNLYDKIWENKRFFRRGELHRFFTDLVVNSLI